jgi:hypothetical protein
MKRPKNDCIWVITSSLNHLRDLIAEFRLVVDSLRLIN